MVVVFLVLTGSAWAWSGAASASSLVYFDGSGNVAAARPDGSAARKLTDDRLTKGPLSVDGKGRIAYFYYTSSASPFHVLIDRNGKDLDGPFLFGNMGLCSYVPPFRSASSPDGSWIAATYIHGNACDTATFTVTTRLIAADGPTLDGSIYGSFSGMKEPRFLPQDQALLSGIVDNQINIWQAPDDPTLVPWIGLDDPSWDIDSFDYDPSRNRMIMEQSPAGVPEGERRDFILVDYGAPAGSLTVLCAYNGLVPASDQAARPRYSPDGKQIAWTGPAGIYVSPAPTNDGGTCTLSPKLVVPGGTNVEWAPFDLENPSTGGKLEIASVRGTTRSGFRKGSTVNVKAPTGGLVKVTATVSKATAKALKLAKRPRRAVVVASGRRTADGAGTVPVKLKPTARAKSAWRKLAGIRVTLRAVQGSRTVTRTIRLTR